MDLEKVNEYKNNKKNIEKSAERKSIQGIIDLSRDFELVASSSNQMEVDIKNVRLHRDTEIKKGRN